MIQFVIFEDDPFLFEQLKQTIDRFFFHQSLEYQILSWSESILKDSPPSRVYLLDFYGKEESAIEIAQKIRENDWTSLILLIIDSSYCSRVLSNHLLIFDLIDRFEWKRGLESSLSVCLRYFSRASKLNISSRKESHTILTDDILYIMTDTIKRQVVIATIKTQYFVYDTLANLKQQLPNHFVYSHRACLVNQNRICKINFQNGTIHFDNGEVITLLSKRYMRDLKKVFSDSSKNDLV